MAEKQRTEVRVVRGVEIDDEWPDFVRVFDDSGQSREVSLDGVEELSVDELSNTVVDHATLGEMRPWRSSWGS